MTNADKIRAMTDEELADWLCDHTDCYNCEADFGNGLWEHCRKALLERLKQEVTDNG